MATGRWTRRRAPVAVCACVAVCCSVLQCVAVCCSVLQRVAVCCSVLQRVAACWRRRHAATGRWTRHRAPVAVCARMCCSCCSVCVCVLQRGSVLQCGCMSQCLPCVAVRCSVLCCSVLYCVGGGVVRPHGDGLVSQHLHCVVQMHYTVSICTGFVDYFNKES